MKNVSFPELKDLILKSRGKRAVITFHTIGDTDAVASAFALSTMFDDAVIASPDFITSNAKQIAKGFGFKTDSIRSEIDNSADMVVLVDVNNFDDCGKFGEALNAFGRDIIIIDHHTPNDMAGSNISMFNDESYNSASSIVYKLLKSCGSEISAGTANLLLAGILSDSAELRNAFPETFVQIGELLGIGGTNYQSMTDRLRQIAPARNREDMIMELFGAKVSEVNGLLMVSGEAKSHANVIADDAIKIGADVALFHNRSASEISFSARLRPPLDAKMKINLGRIMKSLAPIIGGTGGGHPCAAGAFGRGRENAEEFTKAFVKALSAPLQ